MVLITLFCPITITSMGGGGDSMGNNWVDLAIVGVLWTYFPVSGNWNPMRFGVEGYGVFFLNPSILFNTFPFWFISIIFAAQVIRHYTEGVPRKSVMQVGYLSLVPPTIMGLMGLISVVQASIILYVGPIPIQFLVGYILLKYSEKPDPWLESDQGSTDSWLEE